VNYARLREIRKLYFGWEEVARVLGQAPESAVVTASRYVSQGLLVRLKRNVYMLRERWDRISREERFLLANVLQVPSYVSLMSAMDFYGVTTQMQRGFVESIAAKRTREVDVDGVVFNYCRVKHDLYSGFSRRDGFFIASPEKAFLDALYLSSLGRYRFDASSLDLDRLNRKTLGRLVRKFPKRTRRLYEDEYAEGS
jgi:hypothetical protein